MDGEITFSYLFLLSKLSVTCIYFYFYKDKRDYHSTWILVISQLWKEAAEIKKTYILFLEYWAKVSLLSRQNSSFILSVRKNCYSLLWYLLFHKSGTPLSKLFLHALQHIV